MARAMHGGKETLILQSSWHANNFHLELAMILQIRPLACLNYDCAACALGAQEDSDTSIIELITRGSLDFSIPFQTPLRSYPRLRPATRACTSPAPESQKYADLPQPDRFPFRN